MFVIYIDNAYLQLGTSDWFYHSIIAREDFRCNTSVWIIPGTETEQ